MRVRKQSAWPLERIERYLRETRLPLRVACLGAGGYPLINSVWFAYESGRLWCAVPRTSVLARRLAEDPRCGFELAPNRPPYLGVRGQARAELVPERGARQLEVLVDRYLEGRDPDLASWLLGRAADEVALGLAPVWVSAWDYRRRMSAPD